jgi:hypothetical protein
MGAPIGVGGDGGNVPPAHDLAGEVQERRLAPGRARRRAPRLQLPEVLRKLLRDLFKALLAHGMGSVIKAAFDNKNVALPLFSGP